MKNLTSSPDLSINSLKCCKSLADISRIEARLAHPINKINNISINIDLGGDNTSAGSGASQTAIGNTGAPSKATTGDAKALSEKIKSQVLKILTEEQRVGGALSPTARRP